MFDAKFKFFIAFYLQTDGQTEVVNRSLENVLHTFVGEHTGNWDFKLTTAEFAYNTIVNKATGKLSHEIVYDFRPRLLIDIILMSDHIRASDSRSSFASHVHDLHKKVTDKIT